MGFVAARWRRADDMSSLARVGPRRPPLRHLDHLVPARRRPLHRLHVHRGARRDVRRRRDRLLRGALHDHRLSDHLRRSCRGCGRSRTGTATSPRPTSSRAGTAAAGWRWRSRSPASWRRCRTSRCSWSASRWCSSVMGVGGGDWIARDLPLIIAFVVLAAYTYSSGLRAPALIAFVKDVLIYIGDHRRDHLHRGDGSASARSSTRPREDEHRQPGDRQADRRLQPAGLAIPAYATLALGSAMALFMYPHSITGGALRQEPQRDPPQRGDPAGRTPWCWACWRCSATWRIAAGTSRSGSTASPTRNWWCRSCSRTCSPAGSPGSRSPRSRSARWCRRRSCRSRRPTSSPATSTGTYFEHDADPAAARPRSSKIVSLVVKVGALHLRAEPGPAVRDQLPAARRASGSCRRSRPSWSACSPAGSTAGRCWPAGRSG